ncbi:MAG: hypothetical protein AB9866_13175 [Syntrophobacteraceae bacterium]
MKIQKTGYIVVSVYDQHRRASQPTGVSAPDHPDLQNCFKKR